MDKLFTLDFDKKDPAFPEADQAKLHLLCSLAERSIVFTVLDRESNKYIRLTKFLKNTFTRDANHFEKTIGFIGSLDFFGSFRGKTDIIYETEKSTLVPLALFDPSEAKLYSNLSFETGKNEEITWDKLPGLNAVNLYPIPSGAGKIVEALYPDAGIFSSSTVFIESILAKYKNQPGENKAFVNVRDEWMDILIFKNNRMEFFSTFHFLADTDFIYYLIFVFEQTGINPEEADLALSGSTDHRSGLYELVYKYVRNVRFEKYPDNFKYSYIFSEVPAHHYCNLLNFNLCEL